jgi:hypothetical protein
MPRRTSYVNAPAPRDRYLPRVLVALLWTAFAAMVLPRYGSVPAILARIPISARGTHIQITVRLLWAALHLAFYGAAPLAMAWFYRVDAGALGLRAGRARRYLWVVPAVGALACISLYYVSTTATFLRAYPMYRPERADPLGAALWPAVLGAYLFAIELYFRGFLLALLTPALGRGAILVALLPYVATHRFLPEAIGAVPVGLLLGVLRLRARSLWPGYLTHLLVALLIELFARWRHGFF